MRIPVPDEVLPADKLGSVHLIGIGGAGLSAIARLLHQQGVPVSGSDQHDSELVRALQAEGIECFIGHRAENVHGCDTIIASTAVSEKNPEIVAAQRGQARLWPRSAGLMSAMLAETRIAVAGTHGKTTTTAMLTLAMQAADVDVSFAIGAQVPALATNARHGSAGVMVVEADESDGAFLHYAPHAAVITNIDADHLDSWETVDAYEAAFAQFVDSVAGDVVVCADDPGCKRLIEKYPGRLITAGFCSAAEFQARDLSVTADGTTFWIDLPSAPSVQITLKVSGEHYATDALLAFVCAWRFGADSQALAEGLANYTGASRRMELKGEAAGITITDSYAHHPTEIAADLAAARAIAGDRRVVVVFQPHLVSRTRIFGERMGQALSAADEVFVTDIYLAREKADPAVSPQLIVDAVAGEKAALVGPIDGLARRLAPQLRSDDYVLTLGAGDITHVGSDLLDALSAGGDFRGA